MIAPRQFSWLPSVHPPTTRQTEIVTKRMARFHLQSIFNSKWRSWQILIGLIVILVSGGTLQSQDEFSDDQVADLLGLEASEFGRLVATNPLLISDSDLRMALDQLGGRPFRQLPPADSGRVSRVSGTVIQIARHRLTTQSAAVDDSSATPLAGTADAEMDTVYECWVQPTLPPGNAVSTARTVRILTRNIPKLWRHLPWQDLDENNAVWTSQDPKRSLQASALLIVLGDKRLARAGSAGEAGNKIEEGPTSEALPSGLAKRIEWPEQNPDSILRLLESAAPQSSATPTSDPAIEAAGSRQELAAAWANLGAVGFDLGLWDAVALNQRRPLQASDNEPFYQLLRVRPLGRSPESSPLSLPESIRQPQQLVGRSFQIQATIKQVTRVPSDPDDRAAQLGITEYYLLHGVIPLTRPLRLKFEGERQIEYRQHFPVVIATTRLPAGLVVGDQLRQWVSGDGRFFKLWSYQSLRSQEAGVEQWAPLLVSNDLELSGPPSAPRTEWPISGILLVPIGLGLAFLLVFGLRGRSGSKRNARR